jgi:hypothetical protein
MNMMERSEIDMRHAWRELPPLIKGYLRVGAFVGDGAVVDPQFSTTDVLVVPPVAAINARYIPHFGLMTNAITPGLGSTSSDQDLALPYKIAAPSGADCRFPREDKASGAPV